MYNDLYHHGILGQKWGIRRYQNPDGSLTKAGQRRYKKLMKKINKLSPKEKDIETQDRESKLEEEVSNLSTEDIRQKTDRMRAEQEYKNLKRQIIKPKNVSEMTNQELQERVNRIRLDAEYKALTTKKVKSGMDRLNDVSSFLKVGADIINSVDKATSSAGKIMKTFENISKMGTKDSTSSISQKENTKSASIANKKPTKTFKVKRSVFTKKNSTTNNFDSVFRETKSTPSSSSSSLSTYYYRPKYDYYFSTAR